MSNQNPSPGGLPLRALAMVLIAVAIVFAGLGAMSLSSSQGDGAASADSAVSTTAQAAATSAQAATTTAGASSTAAETTTTAAPTTTAAAGVDKSIPVRVLNNSTVAGLAAKTGAKLTANGWNVTSTGNYATSVLSKTTVFYENSPHQQATAQAIASQLGGIAAPRTSALSGQAAGIIVIVTGD
ncbi:LytR C-terminal domain-containing protein [Nocardia macrotermitis]|uniref:LytR/CpsA/Psr regulator C-terminal domain-containing protein n=1 Tax=Nocardia macrotermitis TaxID=2585198 RepID=A0A7K0DDM7_9NOCA|nr:LytR C-terminal domain-containing protein [Nocardia macrotermitis]MQY23768.1 hypothetical protein [Nocardia macrotermitis]